MNLVIDWGNTRLKAGWFDGSILLEKQYYTNVEGVLNAVQRRPITQLIVSSTSAPTDGIQAQLVSASASGWVLSFTNQTPVPVRNAYETPATLGADRLAAAVGAATLFPDQDSLILDLGTCLTADLMDQTGTFQGGLIAPGLQMRFQALHEHTARLPLVSIPKTWPDLTAKHTTAALQSGVLNGMTHELNGIIDAYRHDYPGIRVILCGGDAPTFESRLKPPIFVYPDLVLTGLNRILTYNAAK